MNKYKSIKVGNATYIMDEGRALELVRAMSREFHWAGTLWTTDDIRACILDKFADEDEVDELVSECVNTRWWHRAIDEITTEHGWEVLEMCVDEVVNDRKKEDN
tara:strand:- start:4 stop:315 length:312 start_codon:yes stop_codon:yes gene_type:complete